MQIVPVDYCCREGEKYERKGKYFKALAFYKEAFLYCKDKELRSKLIFRIGQTERMLNEKT